MGGPNSSTKKRVIAVLFGLALVAIAAIILWPRPNNNRMNQEGPSDSEAAEQLRLTRTALASTENLDVEAAEDDWQTLAQQRPFDRAVLQNRALNRLLRVDDLAGRATNASLEATVKQEARTRLPDAIAEARAAVKEFAAVSPNQVLAVWMNARIDLHEASLLPGSMTKSLRREVFDRLAVAIEGPLGKEPESRILGGTFIEVLTQMEDPIDGLPRETMVRAVETMRTLSDEHPDNLYFALLAARLAIESKDAGAVQYVRRTGELARAVYPLVARETRAVGLTPEELVAAIESNLQAGEWSKAETQMLQWFNILNGSEIVKTDRRLATPHPLDRLSFDSMRDLASSIAKESPVARGASPIKFDLKQIDAPESAVICHGLDFDLDLDADLVVVDQTATLHAIRNDGAANFSPAGSIRLPFVPSGIVIADLFMVDSSSPARIRSDAKSVAGRHDTFPCLVLFGEQGVALVCVDGRSKTPDIDRFVLVDADTGLSEVRGITAAVAGDLEADGDLDLVFATRSDGLRMFVNRGNRTFFELSPAVGDFGKTDAVTAIAIGDLDRDLDLDLATTHASGSVGLIENLLHLQFRGRALDDIPALTGASSVAIEEVDGNVSWDLIVGCEESAAIVFSQTAEAGSWTVDRVETAEISASPMDVADLDNDSWLELLAGSKVIALGPGGFGEPQDVNVSPGTIADFTGDGVLDVATVSETGLQVAVNQTANPGRYIDVRFKGIDDNATGRVNHYAIGSVLELRFGPHYRAKIVTSPVTHFGIDGYDEAGNVRAILPNGLTQTIRQIEVNTLVEEEQTLKGSCPFLYAWGGQEFQFVTDCLWAAPLGLQVADGVVAKDRPWEYLKIDGQRIQPRQTPGDDDAYEFRLTEELWEVAYFDHIAMSAIDHPADVEIWTNEKVGPGNIATPTIFAFGKHDRRRPTSAQDARGRNVREQVNAPDGNFMKGFDRRLRQGLCPPHWVDLRFGELPDDGKVYLVMTGWIMPTDTSLNIQIDQNDDLAPIEFPSIWVPDSDADGGWRNAIPFAGFPGGKTKTIVIDVGAVVDRRDAVLRVRTSAQIYWDAAELVVQSAPAEFRQVDLTLSAAKVGYRGFSAPINESPDLPQRYDFGQVSTAPRWPPLAGKLTRLGDCRDLLSEWDDRMVVIGAGDEIQLTFSSPSAPPAGWVRDFIMHNVGWDKDADLNTLAGQSIGPLPYRLMTTYPPPNDHRASSQERDRLNREHLHRQQSFRAFWYRPGL